MIIDLIIFFTYVVIFVTLVLQGLTLSFLIRWLNVVHSGQTEREEREARLKANLAAMARLAEMEQQQKYPADILQRLRVEYEDRIRQLEACDQRRRRSAARAAFLRDYENLQQDALLVERQTILQLRNERVISDTVLRRIQRDLDLAEARLSDERPFLNQNETLRAQHAAFQRSVFQRLGEAGTARAPGGAETVEVPDGETLDAISGHFRIFQLSNGHRFSTDDVLTAWYGTTWCPTARTALDLGSGIGSVGMIAAWRLPGARFVTVEAQEESVCLARKSARYNGLEGRYEIRQGDFREASVIGAGETFDLVLGSPPYFPLGTGIEGDHPQKVACRFELRGDIADYCAAAAAHLAPGGFFACVFPTEQHGTGGIGGARSGRIEHREEASGGFAGGGRAVADGFWDGVGGSHFAGAGFRGQTCRWNRSCDHSAEGWARCIRNTRQVKLAIGFPP